MTIQQVIISNLMNSSVVARGINGLLVFLYLFSKLICQESYYNLKYLGVIPADVFQSFRIWTFFTAGFLEPHLAALIVDGCSLFIVDAVVFPLWGKREWFKFLFLVNISSVFATTILTYFFYFVLGDEISMFSVFRGFNAIQAAFGVTLWQLKPEQKISLGHVTLPIRLRMIPMIYLNVVSLLATFGYLPRTDLLLTFCGLNFSWFYLRFHQRMEGCTGDQTESFAYDSLFPEFVRPYTRPVFIFLLKIGVKLRLVPNCHKEQTIIPLHQKSSSSNLQTEEELDRHRQKGLQALNERLNSDL